MYENPGGDTPPLHPAADAHVHKRRPQSERYLSSADIFRIRRSMRHMRTSALWIFRKLRLSARTREIEPVRTFCAQGKWGWFFAILCGRLLWTST